MEINKKLLLLQPRKAERDLGKRIGKKVKKYLVVKINFLLLQPRKAARDLRKRIGKKSKKVLVIRIKLSTFAAPKY